MRWSGVWNHVFGHICVSIQAMLVGGNGQRLWGQRLMLKRYNCWCIVVRKCFLDHVVVITVGVVVVEWKSQ